MPNDDRSKLRASLATTLQSISAASNTTDYHCVLSELTRTVTRCDRAQILEARNELIEFTAGICASGVAPNFSRRFGKALIASLTRDDSPVNDAGVVRLFVELPLIQFIPEEFLQDQFEQWVKKRIDQLNDDEIDSFVRELPQDLPYFPEWPWTLFDLVEQKSVDPLSGVPDVTKLPKANSKQYGRLWAFLWDKRAFEMLVRYAGDIADRFEILSARRMQMRALARMGNFAAVKAIFATPEIDRLGSDKKDWMARAVLVDTLESDVDTDQKLSELQLLEFLPLADCGKLAHNYRKEFRDHARGLEPDTAMCWARTLPSELSFDPGWAVYRQVTLANHGVPVDHEFVAKSLAGLEKSVELSTDDIVAICNYLFSRREIEALRKWAERGLAQSDHPRLLMFHARSCLEVGEPERAIVSVDRLLEQSTGNDEPDARAIELLVRSIFAMTSMQGEDLCRDLLSRIQLRHGNESPEALSFSMGLALRQEDLSEVCALIPRIARFPTVPSAVLNFAESFLLKNANTAFEQKRYKEACALFKEVVKIRPDQIGAPIGIAHCLAKLDSDLANAAWQEVSDRFADDPDVLSQSAGYELSSDWILRANTRAAQIVQTDPNHVPGLAMVAQTAYKLDRREEAEQSARRILALEPKHAVGLRVLGTLLLKGSRQEEGLGYLETYVQINPRDPIVLQLLIDFQLARKNAQNARCRLDQLRNCSTLSLTQEILAKRLRRLDEELDAQRKAQEQNSYPKVIAVCSVSFSGSTVFSESMGRLAGAVNIGESHRLIITNQKGNDGELAAEQATIENLIPCNVCPAGKPCKTYSLDFRRSLIRSKVQWYKRISEQSNAQLLITSDKNFSKYADLDPLYRFDAVVLFKSPLNSYFSHYKREAEFRETGFTVYSASKYGEIWANEYDRFLHSLQPTGKKLFVNWEMFTREPRFHLQRVCEILDIAFDPEVLTSDEAPSCYFGGNSGVVGQIKADRLRVRNEEQEIRLTAEAESAIDSNISAKRVYAELMDAYASQFDR